MIWTTGKQVGKFDKQKASYIESRNENLII